MSATAASLDVRGLSVHFGGVVALQNVDLTVGSGEIVGIIGPNGAGKTTLFNAVCRLVPPESGTITYAGRSLLGLRAARLAPLGIARTLQGLGLWPRLTVLENVISGHVGSGHLIADLLAFPAADRREASRSDEAMTILGRLGVADRAASYPGALSHGVQKRVIIARALMSHPSLLLLDEPASGLAAPEVQELVELLRTLREHMGVALVEHHLDMVMQVSDRITVLNLGRVIASGTPEQIRANAEVATAYLGEQVANA
jgi:branched-chain amino acid transport system ATP-binding protein